MTGSAKGSGNGRKPGEIDERLFVGSVEKSMKVLECFDLKSRYLSISDIAQRTGLGRSAAQRFAYTLERLGYLRRDPKTRQYALSVKVFRFVQSVLSANTALENSFHLLSRLAEQTKETTSWVEMDDDDIVIISNIPSTHLSSITLPVGTRFPALSASSGQVFYAFSRDEAHVREVFARAAPRVIERLGGMDVESYLRLLEQVRQAGYSITEKDIDQGSLSMSAPVFDYRGSVIATINLSLLKARHSLDTARKAMLPLLLEAAENATAVALR